MKVKDYCVYDVYYCGFLAYVGSGEKSRPNHVRSGHSHNNCLNEVNIRAKVFGEPDVSVKIYKYFDKKEDSLKCEKNRIKHFKPLFNKTNRGGGDYKILSKQDRETLRSVDNKLLNVVERIERVGNHVGVNPNLVFTPYGFRCEVEGVRYDKECFDIVSISTFGVCTALDSYFDYYIDHNDFVVIKILNKTILSLNECLGSDRFENYLDHRKQGNKPFIYRPNYNPNYNGSRVSENICEHFDDNIVLARRVNTYRGVDIILCLRMLDKIFEVFCLNNNQILYTTTDSSDALEAHRNTELKNYEFTTYANGLRVVNNFTLEGCDNLMENMNDNS